MKEDVGTMWNLSKVSINKTKILSFLNVVGWTGAIFSISGNNVGVISMVEAVIYQYLTKICCNNVEWISSRYKLAA